MSDLNRLAQLVTERSPGLTLYARQWLDPAGAEDVVQEAFAALLTQRPVPHDPVAWICRVIRNAAIDHARSASRRRKREREVATDRREWFEPRPDALIDARSAEQALRLLPDVDREIVVLRIWGDLGFAQIAAIAGLSLSTVHNRYTAALDKLRAALENPCKTKPL